MTTTVSRSQTTRLGAAFGLLILSFASGSVAAETQAQPQQAQSQEATANPTVFAPFRLEVVLSRLDGKGTRISRVPYTFSLAGGFGRICRLRMGAEVPVPNQSPDGPVTYRSIGTNIDCTVEAAPGGRMLIRFSIEETSVLGEDMVEPSAAVKFRGLPIFRSYQSTNTVVLGNGESARFTSAVDRVTGETVVAEVTLTVLK